eukprot:810764_1
MAAPKPSSALVCTGPDSKWTGIELLRLNTWIHCICLVDFDLTEGQITKMVYPFDILSSEEKTNIANLSFPDTHTSNNDIVNSKFVFRFRARMMNEKKQRHLSGKRKLSYSHRHKSHPYLFGYVYFQQKRDKSIERGYFQKAIVIITPIPYTHVFLKAVEIIGSLYFEHNSAVKILDTACHNICAWPLPSIAGEVSLPLLGNIIRVVLSPKGVPPSASIILPGNRNQHKAPHNKKPPPVPHKEQKNNENGYQIIDKQSTLSSGGCFQEVNIYRYFHVVLGNLWCLWELALAGQPLLVVGTSAEQCSHAVLGIMSLISPITYHGDFRPYFTIYDDDFKHFCNLHDRDMLPPLILGVTNPFFLKVMPKFPHILVLSDANATTTTVTNVTSDEDVAANHNESKQEHADADDDDSGNNHFIMVNKSDKSKNINKVNANKSKSVMTIHVKTTTMDQHQPNVKKNTQRAWGQTKQLDMANSHNTIISKTNPCLVPDEHVLSRLLTVSKAITPSGQTLDTSELEIEQVCILNNATLRKYFQQLTEKFLEPFQDYFAFKVPSGTWNPYLNPPNIKNFEKDAFLNTIRDIPKTFLNEIPVRMSALPTGKRSTLVKLYSKFLKSPHFPSWFNKKRERAKRRCDKIIHKMIRKIKFERLVEGKPVREGIKMYQTIHRHMNNNNQSAKPKAELNDVLIRHRAVLRSALPSQIIEALDEQVEQMRKEQIEKRKEWQIKYQKHLKQQRAVYNLDNNDNDDEYNDDDSSISSSLGDSHSNSSIGSLRASQSSNLLSKLSFAKRAKSDPHSLTESDLHKPSANHHKKRIKSPGRMLTSPSSSGVKRRMFDLFDDPTSPSIFASAISCGSGLNGGLAPQLITHNIHKYHRHNNKSDHDSSKRHQTKKKSSASLDHTIAIKTNKIKQNKQGTHTRQRALSAENLYSHSVYIPHKEDHTNQMMHMGLSTDDRLWWFNHNSPKMTDVLFDLNNANDFVASNEAKSVVTSSFTATHDDNFKLVEDHFD